MNQPVVTYRTNADGSVTVLGLPHPVKIGAAVVRQDRWFAREATDWHPQPLACFSCKSLAMYHTASKRGGPELVWITYRCGNCGAVENEPFD